MLSAASRASLTLPSCSPNYSVSACILNWMDACQTLSMPDIDLHKSQSGSTMYNILENILSTHITPFLLTSKLKMCSAVCTLSKII